MDTTQLKKRLIIGSAIVVAVFAQSAEAGLIAYEGFDDASGTAVRAVESVPPGALADPNLCFIGRWDRSNPGGSRKAAEKLAPILEKLLLKPTSSKGLI